MFYAHLAYDASTVQGTSSFKSRCWLEDTTPGCNTVGKPADDEWLFARLGVLKFTVEFVTGTQYGEPSTPMSAPQRAIQVLVWHRCPH